MTSRDVQMLEATLRDIDGRGYKAYRAIRGKWDFGEFDLWIDHVQGDPFAAPSRVRMLVPPETTELPTWACVPGARSVALGSHLARRFCYEATRFSGRGSGKSGRIEMSCPGQQVLRQTAVIVGPEGELEARFTVGLPANGRRIAGLQALAMFVEDLTQLVRRALSAQGYTHEELRRVVEINEDAEALRDQLRAAGLVSFVGDGARLPRASGIDDRPLSPTQTVAFQSPASLRVTLEAPNAGSVTGLGIPEGVTLIVGGGYHGKSTLLRAVEKGVYNHRPDDGRERVVTDPDAVKVRAEDGRAVAAVDISLFIGELPGGTTTTDFTSENASGSTSQAAAITEALESGATTLLLDEDTSATNFMIRDRRMQALVPKEGEPITPFVDRVQWLYDTRRISTLMVIGGSGDYLEVADTVIVMKHFVAADVTAEAAGVVAAHPSGRILERPPDADLSLERVPLDTSVSPSRGRRPVNLKARGQQTLEFGSTDIDLSGVEQLVAVAQTRAVGRALVLARLSLFDNKRSVSRILEELMEVVSRDGLDALDERCVGDLAMFRRHELAAAINRLRGLHVKAVSA